MIARKANSRKWVNFAQIWCKKRVKKTSTSSVSFIFSPSNFRPFIRRKPKTITQITFFKRTHKSKEFWSFPNLNPWRSSDFLVFYFTVVWCRRTDELVDGPNAMYMNPKVLDRWEERLEDIFEGCPYDLLDAALSHTVSKFPIDMKVLWVKEKSYRFFGSYWFELILIVVLFFGFLKSAIQGHDWRHENGH